MKKLSIASSALLLLTPFIASAQALLPLQNLLLGFGNLVRILIPILVTIAIVVFFWGLVKYIWGQGKDHAAGRNTMIAGLVSLFIMITLYGVLYFGGEILGIPYFNTNAPLQAPRVQG
ncbi:hypothetical protein K2Q08_03230 [Patescibacteria group bacterium]|nr:hypothetical protein [Patescibacteria group bacterium]